MVVNDNEGSVAVFGSKTHADEMGGGHPLRQGKALKIIGLAGIDDHHAGLVPMDRNSSP
jgi:hypothetical protein